MMFKRLCGISIDEESLGICKRQLEENPDTACKSCFLKYLDGLPTDSNKLSREDIILQETVMAMQDHEGQHYNELSNLAGDEDE